MSSEKYNRIIDDVYENYMYNWPKKIPRIGPCLKEEFINQCKTDDEFAKTWDLKIEERELSFDERSGLAPADVFSWTQFTVSNLDELKVPTKLITVTYKDETIEVYE